MFHDEYENLAYELSCECDSYDQFDFDDQDEYEVDDYPASHGYWPDESSDCFLDDYDEPLGWVPEDDCQ